MPAAAALTQLSLRHLELTPQVYPIAQHLFQTIPARLTLEQMRRHSDAAPRKRIRVEQPRFEDENPNVFHNTVGAAPLEPQLLIAQEFANDVVTQITLRYCDKSPPEGCVHFGQASNMQFQKQTLSGFRFAREPWASGSLPLQHSRIAFSAIKEWILSAPASTLAR
jgi:hypothetical protein